MVKAPIVDQETCIGCGTCVVIAAKTFKLDKDGKVEVIIPPGDEEEKIQEAIDACVVAAITWKEA